MKLSFPDLNVEGTVTKEGKSLKARFSCMVVTVTRRNTKVALDTVCSLETLKGYTEVARRVEDLWCATFNKTIERLEIPVRPDEFNDAVHDLAHRLRGEG